MNACDTYEMRMNTHTPAHHSKSDDTVHSNDSKKEIGGHLK